MTGLESLQAGPTVERPTYRFLQILRAFAALIVVAHHATIMLANRVHLWTGTWINGRAGVDIFFVISGFVMTVSVEPLRQAAHPARIFLARRLERVVPMYWIFTTAKVLALWIFPALGPNLMGSASYVLASYLFFPSLSAEHLLEPIVIVGWTLIFEMAFYLLFALALTFPRRSPAAVLPILLLVPFCPTQILQHAPHWMFFYRSTLLWEFGMGMLLGFAVGWVRRVPWQLGLLLMAGGLWPLMTWIEPNLSYWRGLWWGVPALAIVFGAISMEGRWGALSPRWALELGDASYSIYLVHTFVLPAIGMWLVHLHHGWPGEVKISVLSAVVCSIVAGELAYRLIELPITRWFKGRRRTAVPANT